MWNVWFFFNFAHYFTVSVSLMHRSQTRKLLMKVLSRVRFLKSTICLLLSICLMSWKITCILIAAVGVQLFHFGDEKWFTIAQFKESAAIRAKLTSLLRTPSCHLHQRSFKNDLPSFTKYLVRAELVWRYSGSKIYWVPNETLWCFFQGPDKTNNTIFTLSTLLL